MPSEIASPTTPSPVSNPPAKPSAEVFHPYPWYTPRFWHGMTFGVWFKLLRDNGFAVSWQRWPMAVAITLFAVCNSLLSALQSLIYFRGFPDDRDSQPIFILGHWRSGTTLLHEMLIRDPRFGFATSYECFMPSNFLITEWASPIFNIFVPSKRPMDNMPAGWHHPQEDEFALCNLGAGSPYTMLAFPNNPRHDAKFLDFIGVTPEETSRWQRLFRGFVQRVAHRTKKQLVFKSPPHTARIKQLLEMYPRAKFVHIVRDPLSVYPSSTRLWRSLWPSQGLQIARNEGLEEEVLATFCGMYDSFDRERPLIPNGNFHELRYEDLVATSMSEMEKLYQALELGDFESIRPHLASYLESQKSYQTNKHNLSPEMVAKLAERWGPYMRRYGYFEGV